ncbi:hypothetical protein BDM02DRAFT_3125179 [Thelephora ganbajun]|uniref:Uncharacterized protein n=1 Tax=Thelephora ganbajun TaxID=370292 RepID=A0ACB6ZXA9_THEGA|nr:hypothetical protein BDM02DRAFT_3125179 [Thelephora ganbajun]
MAQSVPKSPDQCRERLLRRYSSSKRYQPYPQPQVLPPGELLVFNKHGNTKRHGAQLQFVIQPLTHVCLPHPMMGAGLILPTTGDYDVEMDETAHVPEVDLTDVEMEDVFLPPIPAIVVIPPEDSAEHPAFEHHSALTSSKWSFLVAPVISEEDYKLIVRCTKFPQFGTLPPPTKAPL